MAIWLVRAGGHGEREDFALDHGVAVIGWDNVGDLSKARTREDVERMLAERNPDAKLGLIRNHTGQLWAFRDRIERGDLIVLPLKKRSAIAIGRVTGEYAYKPDNPPEAKHSRAVEWIRTDIPRTAFDQDLLYSLGAFMTVCQIKRNNAEERIQAMLEGRRIEPPPLEIEDGDGGGPGEAARPLELETYARDLIRAHIGRKFRGRAFERLVEEILRAQGYQTQAAPGGADGGADIIAGRGPMGFDPPRLCVQVKSSDRPLEASVLRELQGVMRQFGAEQGLLVAWGGFTRVLEQEARRMYFEIRLWDADDVIDHLFGVYENLPEDVQAEMPLKRIWTLVTEEEE